MTTGPDDAGRWLAWDRFVEASPASGFMQMSAWAKFRASVGFGHFAVTLKDGEAIVGGALVGKWRYDDGHCFYYVQDGPVLPPDADAATQVFEAVLASVRRHAAAEDATVSHLRIEPRWASLPGFVHGFQQPPHGDCYREPRQTLCIDLRPDTQQILAQMKPKGRYNIRLAQKHGVGIVEDNSAQGVADFLRIQRRTADRQGIAVKPPGYFRSMLKTLGTEAGAPAAASLYFAQYRGRRLATALVVMAGRRATYFYGGSLVLHRKTMAPYALHHHIMCAAKAAGCDWYDLWGVAPPGQAGHAWQQISDFKRKFGGTELALVPTLDLVLDAAAYDHFWRVEREDVDAGTRPLPRPAAPGAASQLQQPPPHHRTDAPLAQPPARPAPVANT